MLNFAALWVLLLAPLPVLVRHHLKPVEIEAAAHLRVPFLDEFTARGSNRPSRRQASLLYLASAAWFCLLLAAAKPEWVGDAIDMPLQGRDIMLAVDLSGSMKERDFLINQRWVNRLDVTKAVASNFIEQRQGDRIGLILFGSNAYLQTPLTFDRDTVKTLLMEAELGLAGDKTAIGDAIVLAVKRLTQIAGKKQPVLILLTDGANTTGEIQPENAAELAKTKHIKIYTIGIGNSGGWGDLDEASLKRIANITEGHYFRANDTQQLLSIYQKVDQLERSEHEGSQFRPTQALFMWPLTAFLLLAGATLYLRFRSFA